MSFVSRIALATALTGALAFAHPAMAGCKRMGFTVNDYGKEGPTRDAQNLLDKHIATWAAEQGIDKYSVGKKDVSCELFLNLIVVDEHTCTASATVCWGPDINKAKQQDAKATDKPKKKEAAAAKSESAAERSAGTAEKPAESKSAETPAAPKADDKSESEANKTADTAPADAKPEEKAAETKPDATPAVETGAIPVPPTAAAAAAAVSPTAVEPSVTPAAGQADEASKAAAAAAESAAAAAERAAAAAERAAQAAERAAAAMAQQQQSGTPATTPSTTPPDTSASVPVTPVSPTP